MSRVRRFAPLAVAAWVILELWLLVTVAGAIGWLWVLAYLIISAAAGAGLVKRSGLRALRGEPRQVVGVVGGLLLIVPGFLTEVAALACLFPPTAKALQRLAVRRGPLADAVRLQDRIRMRMPDGKVVQGEVVREDVPPRDPEDPYGYGRLTK
ncbi:FxsA family protein [Streptacidiphilus monticola]|uniref:FxsA family protein n=1 Tax=Streptacidiphilus monticola TaxID=2161674 RepID=A0ABW1FWJ5_9ACTN